MIRQFTRWDQTLDQTRRCRTLSTAHGMAPACLSGSPTWGPRIWLPNLRTPNLVPQLGDQAPWHLLVRLFKLETQTTSSRGSLAPPALFCNFYLAIENLLALYVRHLNCIPKTRVQIIAVELTSCFVSTAGREGSKPNSLSC